MRERHVGNTAAHVPKAAAGTYNAGPDAYNAAAGAYNFAVDATGKHSVLILPMKLAGGTEKPAETD
jgi:hypothetical protein